MSEVKMIIGIRTDLDMGKGKMVGQGGHVIHKCIENIILAKVESIFVEDTSINPNNSIKYINWKRKHENPSCLWRDWYVLWDNSFYKKITLKIFSEDQLFELGKKAYENDLPVFIGKDMGLTQIPQGTYTALAFLGPKDIVDEITKEYKLL